MTGGTTKPPVGFDDVVQCVEGVDGWLTRAQARVLYEAARAVGPGGCVVEIGSFRGRSTIVLAMAASPDVAVFAIDPHAGNDRGPNELAGFETEAEADHAAFHANLAEAGVEERVRHVRAFSGDALGDIEGEVDLLFIDGAHRYRPALADLRAWGARVPVGGTLTVHDAFSSVGVTLALARHLLWSRRFRYQGRTGSLAVYRAAAGDSWSPALASAARQLGQLPWFARNLVIKALIVAGLGRATPLLGQREATWPY